MHFGRIGRAKQMSITQVGFDIGVQMNYNLYIYKGSNYGTHVCDCHDEAEGCIEEETMHNTCNCDAKLPIPLTDTGDNCANQFSNSTTQEQ